MLSINIILIIANILTSCTFTTASTPALGSRLATLHNYHNGRERRSHLDSANVYHSRSHADKVADHSKRATPSHTVARLQDDNIGVWYDQDGVRSIGGQDWTTLKDDDRPYRNIAAALRTFVMSIKYSESLLQQLDFWQSRPALTTEKDAAAISQGRYKLALTITRKNEASDVCFEALPEGFWKVIATAVRTFWLGHYLQQGIKGKTINIVKIGIGKVGIKVKGDWTEADRKRLSVDEPGPAVPANYQTKVVKLPEGTYGVWYDKTGIRSIGPENWFFSESAIAHYNSLASALETYLLHGGYIIANTMRIVANSRTDGTPNSLATIPNSPALTTTKDLAKHGRGTFKVTITIQPLASLDDLDMPTIEHWKSLANKVSDWLRNFYDNGFPRGLPVSGRLYAPMARLPATERGDWEEVDRKLYDVRLPERIFEGSAPVIGSFQPEADEPVSDPSDVVDVDQKQHGSNKRRKTSKPAQLTDRMAGIWYDANGVRSIGPEDWVNSYEAYHMAQCPGDYGGRYKVRQMQMEDFVKQYLFWKGFEGELQKLSFEEGLPALTTPSSLHGPPRGKYKLSFRIDRKSFPQHPQAVQNRADSALSVVETFDMALDVKLWRTVALAVASFWRDRHEIHGMPDVYAHIYDVTGESVPALQKGNWDLSDLKDLLVGDPYSLDADGMPPVEWTPNPLWSSAGSLEAVGTYNVFESSVAELKNDMHGIWRDATGIRSIGPEEWRNDKDALARYEEVARTLEENIIAQKLAAKGELLITAKVRVLTVERKDKRMRGRYRPAITIRDQNGRVRQHRIWSKIATLTRDHIMRRYHLTEEQSILMSLEDSRENVNPTEEGDYTEEDVEWFCVGSPEEIEADGQRPANWGAFPGCQEIIDAESQPPSVRKRGTEPNATQTFRIGQGPT